MRCKMKSRGALWGVVANVLLGAAVAVGLGSVHALYYIVAMN